MPSAVLERRATQCRRVEVAVKGARSPRSRSVQRQVELHVTLEDLDILDRVAHHYESVMGVTRHIVAFTARRPVREKYRFIVAESEWLSNFVRDVRVRAVAEDRSEIALTLTPRLLVAFWGRLLANLDSRRARRRLSSSDIERREVLRAVCENAARTLWAQDRDLMRTEIATRRAREAEWMRGALDTDISHCAATLDRAYRE